MPCVNFRIILHLFCNVLNFQNLNLHTQHGVDPVHRYCMGVAGLGYSIDTVFMSRRLAKELGYLKIPVDV